MDKIDGLVFHDLKIFEDDRGSLLHILSIENHPSYNFGECYASETKSGVVKAWKMHDRISQNIAVVYGEIRLAVYDPRKNSKTYQNIISTDLSRKNYKLVHIPRGLWYGFKCISTKDALIINCIDSPYNPKETHNHSTNELPFPYEW